MRSQEKILLGVQLLLLLLPVGCSMSPPKDGNESPAKYVHARVDVTRGASLRWEPVSLEFTEPAQVSQLADLFPGLGEGRVARFAGEWRTEVDVIFFTENGEKLRVLISQGLEYWSEGHGDWEVTPECRRHLEELLGSTDKEASQKARTDTISHE